MRFSEMAGLPPAALEGFNAVSHAQGELPKLIYDPPYKHQSEAVRGSLIDRRNLVVMTGTGSGKTEAFLLPILGKLAREASSGSDSFANQPGMRALVLYPMNALVNDQLGRLRGLFGDPRLVSLFHTWAGRPPRFARYTSRTPYAGVRTRQKDSAKFRGVRRLLRRHRARARAIRRPKAMPRRVACDMHSRSVESGRPKPDLSAWLGAKRSRWQDAKTGAIRQGRDAAGRQRTTHPARGAVHSP